MKTNEDVQPRTSPMQGHTHSPEAIARIAEAKRGRPMPETTRLALRKANTGRKQTEETKAKIAAALRLINTGHKHSPETLAKMRKPKRKKNFPIEAENNPDVT